MTPIPLIDDIVAILTELGIVNELIKIAPNQNQVSYRAYKANNYFQIEYSKQDNGIVIYDRTDLIQLVLSTLLSMNIQSKILNAYTYSGKFIPMSVAEFDILCDKLLSNNIEFEDYDDGTGVIKTQDDVELNVHHRNTNPIICI